MVSLKYVTGNEREMERTKGGKERKEEKRGRDEKSRKRDREGEG